MAAHLIRVGIDLHALIDECDRDLVARYTWSSFRRPHHSTHYARAKIDGLWVLMHRLILAAPKGLEVDHRDGNGLNNQRDNIRVCTRAENQRNKASRCGSSRFKGVSFHKASRKWGASIRRDGVSTHLGLFTREEDAARAYDSFARIYFGDFARLNFPQEVAQ